MNLLTFPYFTIYFVNYVRVSKCHVFLLESLVINLNYIIFCMFYWLNERVG